MSDEEEFLINTRQRRSNAGNRLKHLLELEEQQQEELAQTFATEDDENINLLFQEDGEDVEYSEEVSSEEEGEEDEEEEEGADDQDSNITSRKRSRETDSDDDSEVVVNEDDVFSDSDEESEESDAEEGEKELQLRERQKRRAKLKQAKNNIIPKIKPTTSKTESSRKKTHAIDATSLLDQGRRASSRKAVVENKLATVEKLKQLEERRKLNKPKERIEKYEMTQEERLVEAVETEKLNILSLNRFKEQEVSKKERQRALLLSRRKKLVDVIRYRSFAHFISPIDEIIEEKRLQEWIESRKEKRGRKKRVVEEKIKLELEKVDNKESKLPLENDVVPDATEGATADAATNAETESSIPTDTVESEEVKKEESMDEKPEKELDQEHTEQDTTKEKEKELDQEHTTHDTTEEKEKEEDEKDVEEAKNEEEDKKEKEETFNEEKTDDVEMKDLDTDIEMKEVDADDMGMKDSDADHVKKESSSSVIESETETEKIQSEDISEQVEVKINSVHDESEAPEPLIQEHEKENGEANIVLKEENQAEDDIENVETSDVKKVTFATEEQVMMIPEAELNGDNMEVDTKDEEDDKVDVLDQDEEANKEPEVVYEGPEQLVTRNMVYFQELTHPLTTASIKEILLGSQSLLPAQRRSNDVESLLRIRAGTDDDNLEKNLFKSFKELKKPQFKEFFNLPRFGDDLSVSTLNNEEDDLEVVQEIKIATPAPVGIYLANGMKKKCLISGKESQYFDPKNGLPYGSVEAYRVLQQVQNGEFSWCQFSSTGGVYLNNRNLKPASGCPDRF